MLRVTVAVFVLASLFSGFHGQKLTCLCTGSTCFDDETTCTQGVDELCYAAVIRLKDASTRIEKGCKARDECNSTDFCPVRAEGSVCAKFGCCTYDRCVANYTLGTDFQTPTPTPSLTTTQKPLMAKSSSLEPSSSVVPMTTKPEMAATSTDQAKIPATSTVQEKIPATSTVQEKMPATNTVQEKIPATSTVQEKMPATSTVQENMPATSTVQEKMPATSTVQEKMPATSTVQAEMTSMMPTTKMTAVKPMTSAQLEMKSTKENMMSSSMSSVSITPSGSTDGTKPVSKSIDTRPPCANASERVFSLGVFVLVAIGLLCGMF